MDTIKDFFKHINYRLSSPFIFSFVISWLISNWQVTIGFLFYDNALLKIDGYDTYIRLVKDTVTLKSGFCYPLTAAFVYTLLNPIISSAIQYFYSWVGKHSEKLQLKMLGDGMISFDRYLKLKSSLESKTKEVDNLINESTKAAEELLNVKSNLQTKDVEIAELKMQVKTKELDIEVANAEKDSLVKENLFLTKESENLKNRDKKLDSLSEIFSNEWICEFQFRKINDKSVTTGKEGFSIYNDQYVIGNNEIRFLIRQARLFTNEYLSFEKVDFKDKAMITYVKLIRQSEYVWIGYEVGSEMPFSFVRYYRKGQQPKDSLELKLNSHF